MITLVDGKKGGVCRLDIQVQSFNDVIRHKHLVDIEIVNEIYPWKNIEEVGMRYPFI